MKKEEELLRDLKEMIKETRNGAMKWKILCQSTEYNDADQKPVVEENGVKWQVDECYVLYQTTYKGKEFLMISYEMIHSTAQKERTTNLIFLPPAGIRFSSCFWGPSAPSGRFPVWRKRTALCLWTV